jgi:hypothetical protein
LVYKYLTIEILRTLNVKTMAIAVIIGATGTISKSLRKYVSTIPGNNESRSICGGRLEAMNVELWVPGTPSFIKPYCSKRGSATTDPIITTI